MELEHRNVSVVNPAPDVNAVLCFVHPDLTWTDLPLKYVGFTSLWNQVMDLKRMC